MSEEDVKKKAADEAESEEETDDAEQKAKADAAEEESSEAEADERPEGEAKEGEGEGDPEEVVGAAPVATAQQLGSKRFVYGAYFGGAIGVAFFLDKAITLGWTKLAAYKPFLGEPREEIVMPVCALVGAAVALYYWRKPKARTYIEEVADELSKVTWPSRKEVTNGTFVVLVTTAIATVFFALMDQFWRFVTDHVYGI